MKGSLLTLSPACFSDVGIYIIRKVMMSNKEVYILVILISIIVYVTKTHILYKNKNGECPESNLEGVTCFVIELSTLS